MRKIVLLLLVLASVQLFGQQINSYSIFTNRADFQNHLIQNALTVELDDNEYQNLLQDAPTALKLDIPISSTQMIEVDLEENKILADDFVATSQSSNGEQPFNYQPGLYYKGKIVGYPNSLVAISFFDDEIIGVFSYQNGTGSFVIGSYAPDETYGASSHIIYNDGQMLIQQNFDCHTDEPTNNLPNANIANGNGGNFSSSNGNFGPIEIYIEADHKVYTDNSSNLTTANNFITGFFNVSATIYANSSIDIVISQTTVWQTTDPYPSNSSTNALDAFAQAKQNSFNGDLAHFISSINAGNGGLAWVNVICADYNSTSFYGPYAYSNIDNSYSGFPTYSWTVVVFTHETGHNIASPHTHSCSWNSGNSTQIDDCGNIASSSPGACYNSGSPIIPAAGGTIMSYCHLNAVGTNLNFNSQVEALMQSAVINSVCVGAAPYCEAEGTTNGGEWIDSFAIDSITNFSGNNGGYANYRHLSTTLQPGSTPTVAITPGFSGQTYPEYFKIWIDFNQDYDFNDAGEEVFSSGPHTTTASGTIAIPANAIAGNTRLRVAMKYNALPDTCGSYSFGEVEDYTVTIANNSVVSVNNSSVTNVSCNSGTNGSINITVAGGTPPYTYAWSNNATTEDISSLGAGTYSCIITDANGGTTTTGNITVTQPSVVVPNVSVTQPPCFGSSGSASASPSGGSGGFSYVWSNALGTSSTVSNLTAGSSYTVTVSDMNGCTGTQTITMNTPVAITSSGTVVNASCNGSANGSINFTANNIVGTPSYSWSNNATSQNLSNVGAGVYTVTVTDANGCTHSNTFTITEPTAIVSSIIVTQPLCNNGTGSLTASASGGASGFSYNWTGGSATSTLSNVSSGTYMVTITDANGCTTTNSGTITAPPAIGLTGVVTNTSCFGGSNGSINISTTNTQGNTTYAWSNTTTSEDPSGLASGSYTVTATDANGCSATNTFSVSSPSQLLTTVNVTQPICSYNTGGAMVSASGGTSGYSYLWSDNSTGNALTNLQAGAISVTVTDANGCTSFGSGTVNAPPAAIAATPTVTDVLCNGDATGSIAIMLSNAVMPATYLWSDNSTGSSLSNVNAGSYGVTVTDANGCIFSTSAAVAEPSALAASIVIGQHACNGNDGIITVNPSGGTAPYTINPSSLMNLPSGNYTVSVIDANNCPAITQTLDIETTPVSAFDTSIVERTVSFTNNSQNGNSYLWLFGDGNQSVAQSPVYTYPSSGDFTAQLITTNSCGSDTSSIDITVFLVGTETLYDDKRVSVYPNPTSDILNVDFNINGNWQLNVYDVTGKLVSHKDLNIANGQLQQLNVSEWATGTYFLIFQSLDENTRIVKKVIVEK